MSIYICNICNGRCDAGDLVRGICDECREKMKERENKSSELTRKWDKLVIKSEGQMLLALNNEK